MAYSEQALVATVADVIDRIAAFAGANGWTVERNNLVGANRTVTLRKPGVSDYVHLYNTNSTRLLMRLSVGYNAAAAPPLQPNVGVECITVLEEGVYPKIFMFADGDAVWVSLAIARNAEYRSLAFGVLEKVGDYVGGTYVTGTEWGASIFWGALTSNSAPFFTGSNTINAGSVRADVPGDARVNYVFTIRNGNNDSYAQTDAGPAPNGMASTLAERADRNAFSGRSVLHPICVYVGRTGPTLLYSPVGVVHDVRVCSLNKLEPEQEITIGADTWKIFPLAAKRALFGGSGNLPAASGDYGYAVRKVV